MINRARPMPTNRSRAGASSVGALEVASVTAKKENAICKPNISESRPAALHAAMNVTTAMSPQSAVNGIHCGKEENDRAET